MTNTGKRKNEIPAAIIASLIALYSTYPLDVINTKIQSSKQTRNSSETNYADGDNNDEDSCQISKRKVIGNLFCGLHIKTMFTIIHTVTYLQYRNLIKDTHFRYLCSQRSGKRKSDILQARKQPCITTQFMLNSLIAGLCVITILPLEAMAARRQSDVDNDDCNEDNQILPRDLSNITDSTHEICSNKSLSECDDDPLYGEILEADIASTLDIDMNACAYERETKGSRWWYFMNYAIRNDQQHISMKRKVFSIFNWDHLQIITQYWNGLVPSLILTTNPSINFTVYDSLKETMLRYKSTRNLHPALTMPETFLIGMAAKFAAIIVTYPMIRVKMILMLSRRKAPDVHNGDVENDEKHQHTVIGTLRKMYSDGGIKEMYKGCALSLFLTLTRSALFMMTNDRLTV
jgi:hypothetical protein